MKRLSTCLVIPALVCLGMTIVAVNANAQGANQRYFAATLNPAAVSPTVAIPYVLTVTNYSQNLCKTCTPLHFMQQIQVLVPTSFTLTTPTGSLNGPVSSLPGNWKLQSISAGSLGGVSGQLITLVTTSSTDASLVVGDSVQFTINATFTGTPPASCGSVTWPMSANQSVSGGAGNGFIVAPNQNYPSIQIVSSSCATLTSLGLALVTSDGGQAVKATETAATVTLTATLTSTGGNAAIANEPVVFYLSGEPLANSCTAPSTAGNGTALTNGSGMATCTFLPEQSGSNASTPLQNGVYSFQAKFAGDTKVAPFLAQSTSGLETLTVNADGTSITVHDASGTYGGTADLSATLIGTVNGVSGQGLVGKSVTFYFGATSTGTACTGGALVGPVTTTSGGVATLSSASLSGISAGPHDGDICVSFGGDGFYSATSGTGNLNVSQQLITINWSNPANITYGTALSGTQLNATFTPSVSGATVYSPVAGTVLSGGQGQNLTVTFTPSDLINNGGPVTKTVQINVNPAPLQVIAPSFTVSYGSAVPALPPGYNGFVNGDDASKLTTAPTCGTLYNPASPVGSYPVTCSGGVSNNYSLSYVPGSITVNPASSSVTVTGGSFVYDGSAHAATGSASTSVGSLTNPTAVTITYSGSCSVAPTTVAEGATCTATGTYAGDANHTGSSNTASITITKASSSVTVTGGSFVYDAGAHAATASASTTAGTLTNPTAVTITYSGSCSVAPTTVAEGATCTATGTYAGDANHAGSSNTASITITPAGSSVTVTGGSFVYDGSAHAATGSASTTVGTLTNPTAVTFTYTGSCSSAPTTVAEGATCTATGTYAGDANHSGSSNTASITITQATSSVIVTGGSFVYTGGAHAATGSASTTAGSLTNPTAVTIAYSGSCSVAPTTVAEGATCTATGTYAGDANHTGSSNTASITISKAGSSVTVTAVSVAYDGAGHGTTGSASTTAGTLTNPTAVTIVYSGSCSVAPTTVAEGATCTATGTYAGDANHTGSSNTASVTITPASSFVVVTGGTFPYDGAAHAATGGAGTTAGSLTNPNAVLISYSGSCSSAPITVAQGATCTATGTYAGDANHSGSYNTANVTITGASQTITFTSMIIAAKADSGGTVTFSVSTPANTQPVCQVVANAPPSPNPNPDIFTATVTLLQGGTWAGCKVQANQTGTADYTAAPTATAILGTQGQ